MKKLLLASLCILALFIGQAYAQNRTVTGTVTAKDDGLPLPGVSVTVAGTQGGTQTNSSGAFTLRVPSTGTVSLRFSFIGYDPQTIVVPASNVVSVVMTTNSRQLGEVIVTGALGRKFEEKATGYSSTHVTASQVTLSAPTNVLTGLSAKVAGLNITQTGTGVDAGIKAQLRGSRSIGNNNQALIVVDGTPVPGGQVSSIDPNTIESVDVLSGSSGAVLYGTEASNGVIIINTKKGSNSGKPTIIYSNSLQLSDVAFYPKYQKQFGQYGGETLGQGYIDPITGMTRLVPYENELYGPAYDGRTYILGAPAGSPTGPVNTQVYSPRKSNPVEDFYNTGLIEQNSLSIGSGNADDYFNMSVLNIYNKGITPTERNKRTSVGVKGGKKYGIFKGEFNLNYANTKIHQVGSDYNGQSVNYTINQVPASIDIREFQDPTSTFGNPSDYYSAYSVNPWWAVYNSASNTTRNIFQGNISLTLTPTKYLDINYKLTDNQGTSENKSTRARVQFTPYSITDPLGGGNIPSSFAATGVVPGTVSDSYNTGDGNGSYGRLQNDLFITFHPKPIKDITANILVGASYIHRHYKQASLSSTNLLVDGLYNINYISGTPTVDESENTFNQLAFFANARFSYKDYLFLDASIRNDRDSRLRPDNNSYWYPGVNGSFVLTDAIPALKNNKVLNFAKIRASYGVTAQVGTGTYTINDVFGVTAGGFPYGPIGGLSLGTTHYTNLVPEKNTEVEVGAEFGLYDNFVTGKFTYYNQVNKNQTLTLGVSPSTGYSNVLANVGEMRSYGYEASLTLSPFTKAKNGFSLDVSGNLARQLSKVVSLYADVPEFSIGNNQYAVVGQPFPIIKGTDFQRDSEGRVVVSATTGLPLQASTQKYFGRSSPEWIFDPSVTLGYKFMTLNVIGEYRGGFDSYFTGGTTYLFTGSSELTVQNGRQRFIYPNSVINTGTAAAPVYVPNTSISTNDGNWNFWVNSTQNSTNSPYITSGAYWKIREANLAFNLNQFVKNVKFIKGLKFSLTGRNLFIWTPKTNWWGDPDVSVGTSQGGTVTSINSIPAQRIFGARLDVTL